MNKINQMLSGGVVLITIYTPGLLAAPASLNYRLPWAVLDGGGSSSISTSYQLKGSIQSIASAAATSAHYVLVSGFQSPPDTDSDTVRNFLDNCTLIANADQRDTDGDGYGNRCDADLNNNGLTNTLDFGLFKQAFGSTGTGLDADFNGDDRVNTLDFGLFKQMFGQPPGPSGVAP